MTDKPIIDIRNVMIKRLVDTIADMETQIPMWISLKERLPEECVDVLITDGYRLSLGHIFEDNINEGWWNSPDKMLNIITHWMPLAANRKSGISQRRPIGCHSRILPIRINYEGK